MPDVIIVTAYHEAAHAVVLYRTSGYCDDSVTVIPDSERHTLGTCRTSSSLDSTDSADLEAHVLSLFAGGIAQSRIDPTRAGEGCEADEQQVADVMDRCGWRPREQELRTVAAAFVEQHWSEIDAVARELLAGLRLDADEIAIIADIAAGKSTTGELEHYRLLRRR